MRWRQIQHSGDSSQNIQAAVANFGLGYDDVISIVSSYVERAFAEFSTHAYAEAKQLAEELTINYLSELQNQAPGSLKNVRSPGVQAALLDAQAAYAKSGDAELGSILVSLLVERTASEERNVKQLALTQAINTVEKMSKGHIQLLTAIFFSQALNVSKTPNIETLYKNLEILKSPFLIGLKPTASDIQYLGDIGATRIDGFSEMSLGGAYRARYPGHYCLGIDAEKIPNRGLYEAIGLVGPSSRTPGLMQVNAASVDDLTERFENIDRPLRQPPDLQILTGLLSENPMSDDLVVGELELRVPGFADFNKLWNSTHLKKSTITITGQVISYMNAERTLGDNFQSSLSHWVS
ncbi:LPO_1073/Vpar_1526 family protein [Streptomyces sp. NPDC029003]|uniref:LPO_1073/Vpar_1526 family protein n=1 Tax=Streptomyces sp. NPDC029003 TaxID=3155125 RepID=UPI0033C9E3D0